MRIGLLAISGWLVAAVLTVGVSWSAISVVRSSVAPQTQLGLPAPAEATTGTTAGPTTTRPAPTAATGPVAALAGQGGSVTARCINGRPRILNVTPALGFTPQADDSGAEVQFRSADHRTQITVTCLGNRAQLVAEEQASGGGGGGGGDDNGGGGSGRGRGGGGG